MLDVDVIYFSSLLWWCVSHPLMNVLDAHQITSFTDTILQSIVPRLHVRREEVASLLVRPPALLTLTEALEKTVCLLSSYLIRNNMRSKMEKRTNKRNYVFSITSLSTESLYVQTELG